MQRFSDPAVGANFRTYLFSHLLVFTLTCYRVSFFLSLSGILLITLLGYVLYANSVIVLLSRALASSFVNSK